MPKENGAKGLTSGYTPLEEFLGDCLNRADDKAARLTAERDRWRAILAEVVGEPNAEIMYRQPERCAENP